MHFFLKVLNNALTVKSPKHSGIISQFVCIYAYSTSVVHSSVSSESNVNINSTVVVTNKNSMAAAMMVSLATTPAPVPAVNAWVKPINFSSAGAVGSQLQQAATSSLPVAAQHSQQPALLPALVDGKLDKGDQHDSGIDVSDQPNSATSSTRSSPSADNKLLAAMTTPQPAAADVSTTPVLKVS